MSKNSSKILELRLETTHNKWVVFLLSPRRDHLQPKGLLPQKQIRKPLLLTLLQNLRPQWQVELLPSNNQCQLWPKTMELVEAEKSLLKPSRKSSANLISFQEPFMSWSREFLWTKNQSQMLCLISKSSKIRKLLKLMEVAIVKWTWVTLNPKEMSSMLTTWAAELTLEVFKAQVPN